jgi:hypothetical protein
MFRNISETLPGHEKSAFENAFCTYLTVGIPNGFAEVQGCERAGL